MVPKIIVVDESGPKEGANIHQRFILVREEHKDVLLEGLKLVHGDEKLKIMTKEEWIEWNSEEEK